MEQKIQTQVGRQTVTYLEYIKTPTGKWLKILIESDSYDFQSKAVVELHKDDSWTHLCQILYSNMKTPHQLAFNYKIRLGAQVEPFFEQDRDELLNMALALVNETE